MAQDDDVDLPSALPRQPVPIESPSSPDFRAPDEHLLCTTSLLDMLARHRNGDTNAMDGLLRRIGERLERLASRMLRHYPIVCEREQTDDVLQNALVRLTRALREVSPSSTASFFGLAAEQIRRELLDLARYHRRRTGVSQPFPSAPGQTNFVDPNAADPRDLDRWQLLHEAVERLPAELREVFRLTFYHGWTQTEMAQVLGVSDRQVRRLWLRACRRLNEMLGGDLPAD